MNDPTVEKFLTSGPQQRMLLALDRTAVAALRRYMGDAAFDEYAAIAERVARKTRGGVLSVEAPTNLIFVPGVMGSLLVSTRKGGVWWIDVRTRQHIDDLKLSPDGERDADERNKIAPVTVDPSYEAFLAAVLERDDFGHEMFPYDWRKPLKASAAALRDRIVQTYESNGGEKVHLVAHSMGGLMVRATLMLYGEELWPRKVGKVLFIGTPHYGSPAIAGYLKNHLWGFDLLAVLGRYLSRETFRTLWGVIGMLPAPRGIYPGTREAGSTRWRSAASDDEYEHPCANFDMYDASAWKLDLDAGQNPLGIDSLQKERLQKVLDGAAMFHREMYEAHMGLDQEYRDRMAVIAGVGYKTLFRLAHQERLLGLWETTEKVTSRIPGDVHREGDGRVPVASATLEYVREVRYVKGIHGGLPMIPDVYEDTFRWLNGETMQLPTTPAGALGQNLSTGLESESPNLDGTALSNPSAEDPGYWKSENPDSERVELIESKLEREQLPEFTRVRLL